MNTIKDINLERLRESGLPAAYVEEHHGAWNHQDWLDFCSLIEESGYTPIDLDRVGLLLESLKLEYWNRHQ